MSKYDGYGSRQKSRDKQQVHPIWRGVGFALMVLIPILSYAGALVLLEENGKKGWIPIPRDLMTPWFSDPLILIKILVMIVLMVILYGVFMMITFLINRAFAPPRYGPTDVPPTEFRGRHYKR